jgi:hypothetical protein
MVITGEILLANNFKEIWDSEDQWHCYRLEIKNYGIIDIMVGEYFVTTKINDKLNKMNRTLPYRTVELFNKEMERINWNFRLIV